MNIQLDGAEQLLIRQVAEVVAAEVRDHVLRDLAQQPVLWSKKTAAYMIGGEQDHASVRFVEDLIADGEIDAIKSGPNGGGRTWIVPESVETWARRKRHIRRRQC